jgi:general secretion pathway protein L
MLSHILAWWRRQMLSLIPRRFINQQPDAVIIAIDRLDEAPFFASGAVLMRRGGSETRLSPLSFTGGLPANPAPRLPTALRLPAGMVLQRDVTLPLAAERDVASVIGFELDRLTPFDPDQVFWGVNGVRRDPRGLRLNLLVTLRAPVEQLLEALSRVQLKPAFLEAESGRIALSAAATPGRRLGLVWWGVCLALLILCLAIPVIRQQNAIADTAQQIAALQPAEQAALALRQTLAIASSGQAAVKAAQSSGDALQMVAALTDALPDGTYLSDLTLKDGDLTIDGQSSNAAKLIAVLSGTQHFQNPSFSAPVTRAINGSADLFSIRATVAP